MVKITYKTGDKVFAKVKGYPPWPARVEGDTGKKKYNVLFYGTQETGAIKPEDLCYYSKNKDSYIPKYLKRAGYEDAVKQIEEAINKDGGDGNDGVAAGEDSTNDIDVSDVSSVSSISDKKIARRKVASLPDEPLQKKPSGKTRRRSVATTDSKADVSEEPVSKKPRRKSNSSDNGIKEIPEEKVNYENQSRIEEKMKSESCKIEKVKDESSEEITESEIENSDSVVKSEDSEATKSAESRENGEESKKPKEPEFVAIENNTDSNFQLEEEALAEVERTAEKTTVTVMVEIVTEQMLKHNILYGEHVKKNESSYKDKPAEKQPDSKNLVLPVQLPSGAICGIKLYKEWPVEHNSELERALYDEQVSKSVLDVKKLLTVENKAPDEIDAVILPDIQMTSEDIKELTYGKDIEIKRKRLNRLRKEADLVTWDSKIKNNLGLDNALPDAALECLKEFGKMEKDLDTLMLKKHPHVVDTVRRLRKYVGNVKEWDMAPQDMDVFTKKAEKIRNESERIYNKIKNVIETTEEKGTFWESFMELVSDFRIKCKGLTESEILVLCAEPDSRQAFLDKLDEQAESEGTTLNPSNTSEPVLKETSLQGWTEKK